MSASHPIAFLVQTMLAAGASHDALVEAVTAAERDLHAPRNKFTRGKGTRLPEDWTAPDSFVAYAQQRGIDDRRVLLEVEKFKNYWIAKAGSGAVKRDWFATWRNWILNAMEARHVAGSYRSAGRISNAGRSPTGANAVLAGMGRLADRLVERRNAERRSDGQMEVDAHPSGELDLKGRRT